MGSRADILTYLAIGDGGDQVAAFDPAKDVIDLSGIDANLAAAPASRTSPSSAPPHSAAPALRCVINLNPTDITTYSPRSTWPATRAGRLPRPISPSRSGGWFQLAPAANFALTSLSVVGRP